MNKCRFVVMFVMAAASLALAEDAPAAAEQAAKVPHFASAWLAISAGLAMALASVGGAISQGRVASAAMEGIARNPGAKSDMFLPFILGMALIESLVLFTFVIAFFLQGKI